MAKTIIGMILAGSMVVTSYAATKLPTEKPAQHGLQNIHWTLDAAGSIGKRDVEATAIVGATDGNRFYWNGYSKCFIIRRIYCSS